MTRSTDAEDVGVEAVEAERVDAELVRAGLRSADNLERDEAAARCLALAEADPGEARQFVPALVERLDDESVNVRLKAVAALNHVADAHPDALEDAVGDLCALLTHDLPRLQYSAARTVQLLGVERPEWFVGEVDALLAALEADVTDPTGSADGTARRAGDEPLRQQLERVGYGEQFQQHGVRAVAGNLLVEASRRDPGAVVDVVPRLRALLDAEDLNVVACAVEVLGNAARADADAVRPARPALVERLDEESDAVVAQAIRTLGYLGDEEAASAVRAVAADGSREGDVRSLADDTAAWLAREP